MPGELWHAPEANFFFRINKVFPTIERVFHHERYYHRLTLRAHNGKILSYLICQQYRTILTDRPYSWTIEENTLQLLHMLNNICIRKEKELLKRHMHLFVPRICTYTATLRLIEDQRSTCSMRDIYHDRSMIHVRAYYRLLDERTTTNDNLLDIYRSIRDEYFPNRTYLQQWTWKEHRHATDYFSFRKIFTTSMSIYSTLNYVFGFRMFNVNHLYVQRSIGNVNPLYLMLTDPTTNENQRINLPPNIDTFINRLGKTGPFTATILATLNALARSKYHLVDYMKIFYKEDFHLNVRCRTRCRYSTLVRRVVSRFDL
jgi:hypothetical protein